MSVTLKLRQALIVDGHVVLGDKVSDTPITLANGQQFAVEGKVIADDYGEDVLWETGDGGMDTFSHGFIYSDKDVWLQMRNTQGTPQYILRKIDANVLTEITGTTGGSTSALIDGADLVEATDWDQVDQIRVQRDEADGEGDASVSLYLFS